MVTVQLENWFWFLDWGHWSIVLEVELVAFHASRMVAFLILLFLDLLVDERVLLSSRDLFLYAVHAIFLIDLRFPLALSLIDWWVPIDFIDDFFDLFEWSCRHNRILREANELLVNHAQILALGFALKDLPRQTLDDFLSRVHLLAELMDAGTGSSNCFSFLLDCLIVLVGTREPVFGFLNCLLHNLHFLTLGLLVFNYLADFQIDWV